MPLRPIDYTVNTYATPEHAEGALTPDEIMEKMAETSWEHRDAINQLKSIEIEKTIRESKLTVIIHAKKWELLQNPEAREHFKLCCGDPKGFRPTVDFVKALIYWEQQEIMEKYNHFEMIAKRAEKQHEMLVSQLIWYQSKNKVNTAEMHTISGGSMGC